MGEVERFRTKPPQTGDLPGGFNYKRVCNVHLAMEDPYFWRVCCRGLSSNVREGLRSTGRFDPPDSGDSRTEQNRIFLLKT